MKRKIKTDTLKVPAAGTDVTLTTALDKAFKGFDFTTSCKKSAVDLGCCVLQHKGCQRLDTKIKILAKQVLVNQWFASFSLLANVLLVLKIYGFGV